MLPVLVRSVSEVAKEVSSYYPVIVPSLLVFYLESLISLKLWTATQFFVLRKPRNADESNGIPPRCEGTAQLSLWTWSILVFCIVMSVFIGTTLNSMQRKILDLCMLLVPSMICLILSAAMLLGILERRAVFTPDRLMIDLCLVGNVEVVPEYIIILIAALVAVGAIWFKLYLAILIAPMAILHFLATLTMLSFLSMAKFRMQFWAATGMGLLQLLLAIAWFFFPQKHASGDDDAIQWGYVFISALALLVPLNIIAALLRFDTLNTEPKDFQNVHLIYTDVAVIYLEPAMLGTFPRPYYTMAFVVFTSSFVILAALSAVGVMRFKIEEVGFYAACLAALGMVYGALFMATLKGQLRSLWMHDYWDAWIPQVEVVVDSELGSEE